MSISWSEFSWEAFATLVAGLAAVGAAWRVGRNQLEIQGRQTKLLENDLKIQLLEKRAACVSDMREIRNAYLRDSKFSNDEMFKLHKLVEQTQLLFPSGVSSKLDKAAAAAFRSGIRWRRAMALEQAGKHAEAAVKLEEHFSSEDEILTLLPELVDDLVKHTRVDAWE